MEIPRVRLIPALESGPYLDRLRELLAVDSSLVEPYTSVQDVVADVVLDKLQLWVCGEGEIMLLSCFVTYPQTRVFQVSWCAGEGLKYYLDDIIISMVRFAASHHIKRLEVIGRKGWEKIFAKHNFKFRQVVLVRDI